MSSARETAERIIEDGHGCAGLAACFRETCTCAAAIAAAILAERDECAKVATDYAESVSYDRRDAAEYIAASIRARQ